MRNAIPQNLRRVGFVINILVQIIADAVVGVVFVRNALATVFIFASAPWIAVIGLQYMILTLSMLILAVCLSAILFLAYGKVLRVKTAAKYKQYSMRHTRQGNL